MTASFEYAAIEMSACVIIECIFISEVSVNVACVCGFVEVTDFVSLVGHEVSIYDLSVLRTEDIPGAIEEVMIGCSTC